jgi:hypothetical protein
MTIHQMFNAIADLIPASEPTRLRSSIINGINH